MKSLYLLIILVLFSDCLMAEPVEGIFGNDDREAIYDPNNDELSETKNVGRLAITTQDGKGFTCSGTIVGPNLVLTSAHCFVDSFNDTIRRGKTVFNLRQSGDLYPYEPVAASKVYLPDSYFYNKSVNAGYLSLSQSSNDYALVVLNENIGDALGWHGVSYDTDEDEQDVEILSYPGDKNNHLMYEQCSAIENYNNEYIYDIDCDIVAGSSGGALLDKNSVVVGIVSSGNKYGSYAFRFSPETFKVLKSWVQGNPIQSETHEIKLSQYNNFKVVFENKCSVDVNVAYKVKTRSGWVKDGLYILRPDSSITVNNITGKKFYYYGQSDEGVWEGSYDMYLSDYDETYSLVRQNMSFKGPSGTWSQGFTCR